MYRIEALERARFAELFSLGDEALAARRAVRVTANSERGFPCRVSLDHAAPGEGVLLVNFVSNDVATPYRTAFAIYVREAAGEAPAYVDRLPPVLEGRVLSLRGYDGAGMLQRAVLAGEGEAEAGIADLFGDPDVACIHAHSATYGCFLARIERN